MKFKFIIYTAKDGTRWHCKRGSKIVCESGEAYSRAKWARKAVAALTHCMVEGTFTIKDQTIKPSA